MRISMSNQLGPRVLHVPKRVSSGGRAAAAGTPRFGFAAGGGAVCVWFRPRGEKCHRGPDSIWADGEIIAPPPPPSIAEDDTTSSKDVEEE